MTIKSILAGAAVALGLSTAAFAADVKVGFVYVGPTGDHGWTYRHDIGRQQVEEAFGDRVETTFGLSYHLANGAVFKADYQSKGTAVEGSDAVGQFNLGLGVFF